MRIRGHHLFCTTLFSGHGYDEAFSVQMDNVIRAAKAGEPMELVLGPDEICKACPHRRPRGSCALGTENVLHRDSEALQVLGLGAGRQTTWEQTRKLLARIEEAEFRQVCRDCRWQKEGLCSAELLHQKTE